MTNLRLSTLVLVLLLSVNVYADIAGPYFDEPIDRALRLTQRLDPERYMVKYVKKYDNSIECERPAMCTTVLCADLSAMKDCMPILVGRPLIRPSRWDRFFDMAKRAAKPNEIDQKPIRSPSLRLRFGRRSDPLVPLISEYESVNEMNGRSENINEPNSLNE